ncbi:spermidine/spermine N(1)-acetyltransferase-like protein 1 isoform X2 [Palaemon carinicauda]
MKPSTVREAKLSDCQILANLMQESGKEQERGVLTCKDLEKKLFGNHPVVKIIISENEEGVICGYLLYNYRYSTIIGLVAFLADIYVIPEHRRRGVATAMWNAMVKNASAVECKRCEVITKSPNEFLLSLGAFDATDFGCKEMVYEIEKEAIKELIKRKDSPNKFTLRGATLIDVPGIIEGVKDLHSYLGRLHEVVCDEAELIKHGFGKHPAFKSFVAEQNGAIVGYTMFSYTFGLDGTKIYMEDLYVSPECRGAGIGISLWMAILKEGLQNDISCCNHTVDADNKPSAAFYKSHGAYDASQTKNIHFFKIPLEERKL